jgi:hypothetical protein
MFARSDIQGFLNRLLIGATPRSRVSDLLCPTTH